MDKSNKDYRRGYMKKMGGLEPVLRESHQITEFNAMPKNELIVKRRWHFEVGRSVWQLESQVLESLEGALSSMDNLIMIQALFPKWFESRRFKAINWGLRQVSKVYLIVNLLNLKKWIVRYWQVGQYMKLIDLEYEIVKSFDNSRMKNSLNTNLVKWMQELVRERFYCMLEIVNYLVELILNVDVAFQKFRLNRKWVQMLGVLNWVINIYRASKAVGREGIDQRLSEIHARYYH